MHELKGGTALVTGCDSGIGLGIAHALIEAGMTAVICGIVEETLEKAQAERALARGRNRREADGDPTAHDTLVALTLAAELPGLLAG